MVVADYLPQKAEIIKIIQETGSNLNIKTFHLRLTEGEPVMDFQPGQFLMLTVPGVGEAPFGLASAPLEEDYMVISVKKTGKVTAALHECQTGDVVGLRGPLGNHFPVAATVGKNIVFISGGIGLAPLRSLIAYVLHPAKREEFGRVQMLQAFRSPEAMLYDYEQSVWEQAPDTVVKYTIDRDCETGSTVWVFPMSYWLRNWIVRLKIRFIIPVARRL